MLRAEKRTSAQPVDSVGDDKKASGPGLGRLLALALVLVGVVVVSRAFGVGARLGELREWIYGLGALGPAVFVGLYAAAVVAAVPGSALTVAAGALFGSALGVAVVSVASTLGASLAFLLARYLARDAVSRALSGNDRFARLDRLTEKQGAMVVAFTRLVPLFPFSLLNYGFGLTRVPFWTYVFWSWLCMLPATVVFVVGADAVTRGLMRGEVPWVLIAALCAAGGLLAFLVRQARRRLQRKEMAVG